MKWLGQHIWDFISRFRSDVYLENLSDHGSDPDRFLTADSSTGKVTYRTGTEVLSDIGASSTTGDITSVIGGTNCTVSGGTSGDATVNVDDAFLINDGSDTTTGTITAGGFTVGTNVITDDSIVMTPSTDDTVTIAAATNGVLNITTVDDNAAAADLTFTVDGKITMTPADITGIVFHLDGNADTDNIVDIDAGRLNIDSSENTAITAVGTAELAGSTVTLDSAGDIELEVGATSNHINTGGIFRGGNIGVISDLFIPILWNDFILSNSYRFPGTTPLGGLGFQAGGTGVNYYAIKLIPKGYTATSCIIYGVDADEDSTIRCYSSAINSATVTPLAVAVAFDNATTPDSATFDFGSNDIVGDGLKTCQIEYNPADAVDRILGGTIIIEKT